MATFDFERLDAELYNLDDTDGAIEFQDMVEDFMNVAKTNPAVLEGKNEDVAHFCAIVADDEAWPLAQLVVPEFCVTQYVAPLAFTTCSDKTREIKFSTATLQ
jgi:hypothetical protein